MIFTHAAATVDNNQELKMWSDAYMTSVGFNETTHVIEHWLKSCDESIGFFRNLVLLAHRLLYIYIFFKDACNM